MSYCLERNLKKSYACLKNQLARKYANGVKAFSGWETQGY